MFGKRVDSRARHVRADTGTVFRQIERIGGDTGYYYANWVWRVRIWVDRMLGGPGRSRVRVDPSSLHDGEEFECWRVARLDRDHQLQLDATMKMPGRGFLLFEVEPASQGCVLRQTASFVPRHVAGLIYWYCLYPIHLLIWEGMLRRLSQVAEAEALDASTPTASTVHGDGQ